MQPAFTANLAAFLDQTLDAVLATDDDRRLLYVNDAATQLFARERTDLLGSAIDDLMDAPPGSTIGDLWARFIAEGKFRGRMILKRAGAPRRDVEVTATAHWRPGIHVGFCRDVTDRALAERRLATQYEIAQALTEASTIQEAAPRLLGALAFTLEASAAALWVVDRRADALRCAGVWVGDEACGYLGIEAPTVALRRDVGIPGKVWARGRMLRVADLATVADSPRVASALACGFTTALALPVFGSYGVIGVAEFFGAAIEEPDPWHLEMMTGACNQLSQFVERRRSEGQLLVMGKVGFNLPVGLVVWHLDRPGDKNSLRLIAVNPAAKAMTPWIDWHDGMAITELLPDAIRPEFQDSMLRVVETGVPLDFPEAPTPGGAGTRLFNVRLVALSEHSVGVLFEDVTERRRVERSLLMYTGNLEAEVNARIAQIQRLEAERARAEKLASTGRLAARVAHEIINPLASIKNAFALVKDGVRPDFPHAHYVPRIEREIDRIARIVGQMRELYRPITEPVMDCDVVELTQDVLALAEPEAEGRRIQFRLKASEWPLYAAVQQDGLRQILQNLLRNALDASPAGGVIEVTVSAGDAEVELVVADQGPGVPEALAEQVFEPFFTTKSGADEYSGLGLGLTIAQGLALAMRGHLSVLKGQGRGAAFRLAIPRGASTVALTPAT